MGDSRVGRPASQPWKGIPEREDRAIAEAVEDGRNRPASERETQILQGILDRHRPICVMDFHTADYGLVRPHRGDDGLIAAIHAHIKARLRDRFLCQRPNFGPFQQVNMEEITKPASLKPYVVDYAAKRGVPAAFVIEMSGNRDDVHALVMNVDTVVEICLAATEECLGWTACDDAEGVSAR
jgi:hypothetical protein